MEKLIPVLWLAKDTELNINWVEQQVNLFSPEKTKSLHLTDAHFNLAEGFTTL